MSEVELLMFYINFLIYFFRKGVYMDMFNGITSATFNGVLDTIKELIPIVVPSVVGFLAFRKGWSFLKGEVKKA